jgi:glycosyltransferase involved in cell wall biosynthesis
MKPKLIRITTVPMALKYLLPGQMHFMQQNGFDVLMISADGKELQDVLQNEQCPHAVVPMTRKITPLQDLKCLFQLIKIFKKYKPDIVHTHTPKAGLLGMMAAKLSGVKVRIHTVAGLPLMVETGFRYKLLKFIEKITYYSATHIWPNSNSLLQFIKEKKLTADKKLSVIGKGSSNGINTNRFSKTNLEASILENVKATFKYNPANIYLLCIGRLVKDKGIPELVQAFVALQHSHRNLKLILVGDFEEQLDPLPAETQYQIKHNGDIKHITWTDHVEYYMSLANYFVFPSHREGFPNVLLQAAAMQLPIICSQIEGNVDIVTHQQTGLIFTKQNIEQLQHQIEYAIANPATMQQMANELYNVVQTDYKRENMWQNILQRYKKLIQIT